MQADCEIPLQETAVGGYLNPSYCGHGLLKAYDVKSGDLIWNRTFPNLPANIDPVVYQSSSGLAVVIGLGLHLPDNFKTDSDKALPRPFLFQVVAVDALTGADKWYFDTPPWNSFAGAGSTESNACQVDSFGNAGVDGNGTVYP
jgi:outer membrane protein assembly factor BamB